CRLHREGGRRPFPGVRHSRSHVAPAGEELRCHRHDGRPRQQPPRGSGKELAGKIGEVQGSGVRIKEGSSSRANNVLVGGVFRLGSHAFPLGEKTPPTPGPGVESKRRSKHRLLLLSSRLQSGWQLALSSKSRKSFLRKSAVH